MAEAKDERAVVELLSLAAYPALEEQRFGAFAARAANGYTKRANSARLVAGESASLAADVEACERFYAERGQSAIFRLLDFDDAPQGVAAHAPHAATDSDAHPGNPHPLRAHVDKCLAARHYAVVEPSRVMAATLDTRPESRGDVRLLELATFAEVHARVSRTAPEVAYTAMLARVQARAIALAIHDQHASPLAAGLAVVDSGHVGLFNLAVAPELRGQGLGTALAHALLAAGFDHGARRAYLQVVAANPARRLYTRLGFDDVYAYHYRVRAA